jgi:hypothetical protein
MTGQSLRRLVVAEAILLYIQFWLGMSLNLFIPVPSSTPFDFLGYDEGVILLAHILNAFLILIVGSYIAYIISRDGGRWLNIQSLLTGIFVVVALIAGFVFILAGQDDSFSMTMAMSFISVFTVYFAMIYQIGKMEGAEQAAYRTPPG